jgi:hypothetical protein
MLNPKGDAMMHHLSHFSDGLQCRYQRLRRALAYATSRLSSGHAQDIILDCHDAAGWYLLMIITPDDVLDRAITLHGEKARVLEPHVHAACSHVSHKWDSGDDYCQALDWAVDAAVDYARQDGIELDETEDESVLNPQGDRAHA